MLLLKDMYFIYLKKVYKISVTSVTSVTKEAPCPGGDVCIGGTSQCPYIKCHFRTRKPQFNF